MMWWNAVLKGVVLFWVAVFATVSVDGCGSSSGNSEESIRTTETTTENVAYPKGPTRQFFIPGGDNAVQTFGREATPAERRQATANLSAWMRARAVADWTVGCSYLSRAYRNQAIETGRWGTQGKAKRCPEALVFLKSQAPANYADNFGSRPVVSLRMEDGRGFAQYHGNDGKDWVMPMEREDGHWKVANLNPIDRNK